MKASEAQLLKLMSVQDQQFVVPIYQRQYSWKEEQCIRLWRDVEAAAEGAETTHFFGSIVYIKAEDDAPITDVQQCLVIDGQQRLTTVTLMLVALRTLLKERISANTNVAMIDDHYLFNEHAEGDKQFKLILQDDDRKDLNIILRTGSTQGVTQRRFCENFEFFLDAMRHSSVSIDDLYAAGLAKLTVVDVVLMRGSDNPQRIFESLNSTGLDLTQSDRVRNFVLMDLKPGEQERLFKDYWQPVTYLVFDKTTDKDHFDEFLRDYLTMTSPTGEIPNRDHVYEAFCQYVQRRGKDQISAILADLCRYASYYACMLCPAQYKTAPAHNDSTKATPAILDALQDINRLDMSVSYPFILEVFDDYAHGSLREEEFVDTLHMIESYVMRRLVCSIPTNSLAKTFARLSREVDKSQYLDSLRAALVSMTGSQRLPSDEEFQEAFKSKDMYHLGSTRARFILERLENFGKKEFVPGEYTVEHIMPQTLTDSWRTMLGADWERVQKTRLHILGNLTLTGYNSSYSNCSFCEKRDMRNEQTGMLIGFKGSPVTLNQDLAQLGHWDEQTIMARTERLARLACSVWPAPRATAVENPSVYGSGPDLSVVLAHIFVCPEELSYAQELTTMLVHRLDPASTLHLLAVTCNEKRISLDVGNWLVLGFERSKKSVDKLFISLAVDQDLLSDDDKAKIFSRGNFSTKVLAARDTTFEWGRYALVGIEQKIPDPLSPTLVTAWSAAINETNQLFRSWKTGAFSRLHRQDLLEKLVPEITCHSEKEYEHFLQGTVEELYDRLSSQILDLDVDLVEERMATYIAYKLDTNVVDIVPRSDHLCVYLNMPFEEVVGHADMIHDVSGVGHQGNGDVALDVNDVDQLPTVVDLVSQSVRWHRER